MLISFIFAVIFAGISFACIRGSTGIFTAVLTGIVTYLLVYFGLPTLSYGFYGIPFFAALLGGSIIIIGGNKNNDISFVSGLSIFVVGLVFVMVIPFFATPVMMGNAEAYRAILSDGEVDTTGAFDSDVAYIDPTQTRMVDQTLAVKLAETKLGEDAGLGSRVTIGAMRIQNVGGKLFWVGPLEWSTPVKWAFGDAGTPGYMVVSAFNQRDVRLVKEVAGEPLSLEIGEGAYMWDDLDRYVWRNGYASTPYADFTFEVNDEWRPYWVITRYERTVGYSGNVANGVIVVDPQTREIESYDMDKVPEWIDRVQPESFIAEQVDDWGKWVHGFWGNFEGLDKLKHTPGQGQDSGLSLVYGSDGRAKWYTGIQSDGADQGTTGFMLVDTRTGKAKYYRQSGITEQACQRNIAGLIAEKTGWSVTNCILYNVAGHPTYIAIIKDADGNPKQIGVASVVNRDVVVSHNLIKGALRAFRANLRSKGNVAGTDSNVDVLTATGIVMRFGSEVLEGNTYFYVVIDTEPHKVFMSAPGLNSAELPVTLPGDRVTIHYDDAGRSIVDMTSYDNQRLTFQRSETEVEVEIQREEVPKQ